MDENKLNKLLHPNSKILVVIGFILSGLCVLFIFACNNYSEGKDHLEFTKNQLLATFLMSIIGSGTLYKYKKKILRLVFSETAFFFALSLIVFHFGLSTFSKESIYLKGILYTGSEAIFIGIIAMLTAIAWMYYCIITFIKDTKANKALNTDG